MYLRCRSESESYITITGGDVCVGVVIVCQAVPPYRTSEHVRGAACGCVIHPYFKTGCT